MLVNSSKISWKFLSPGGSMGPGYVFSFYLVKNHKTDVNSTATKAREKVKTYLESLEFKFF